MRIVAGYTRGGRSSAQRRWRSGTLSDFRKTEFGHLHIMIAFGGCAGRGRV